MLRSRLLTLAPLALLAACGHHASVSSASTTSVSETTEMTEQFHTLIEDSSDPSKRLEMTIEAGVSYGWYSDQSAGNSTSIFIKIRQGRKTDEPVHGLSIAGKSVTYKGDELLIGEESFGALVRPVTILINTSGVYVNDELRGQL